MKEKIKDKPKKTTSSTPVDDKYEKMLQMAKNLSKEDRVDRVYQGLLSKFYIPKRFQGKTFDNYKPYEDNRTAYEKVKEYADSFADRYKSGDWLILSGGYGLGKTHLSLACARKCLKFYAEKYVDINFNALGYPDNAPTKAIFDTSTELIQKIRDSYSSDNIQELTIMRRYKEIPLLIIDDLGAEKEDSKEGSWYKEKMYAVLDYRYREMLPTIITTNLNTGKLKGQVSERVVERMIEAAGKGRYLWKFQGDSYRQKRSD